MQTQMRRIVLAKRPEGSPAAENFRPESVAMPSPGKDETLARVIYLPLDPYMRGRMDDAKSYAQPVAVGEAMEGGCVAEGPEAAPGAFVSMLKGGNFGKQLVKVLEPGR